MEEWVKLKIIRGNKRKREKRLIEDLKKVREEIDALTVRIRELGGE